MFTLEVCVRNITKMPSESYKNNKLRKQIKIQFQELPGNYTTMLE